MLPCPLARLRPLLLATQVVYGPVEDAPVRGIPALGLPRTSSLWRFLAELGRFGASASGHLLRSAATAHPTLGRSGLGYSGAFRR